MRNRRPIIAAEWQGRPRSRTISQTRPRTTCSPKLLAPSKSRMPTVILPAPAAGAQPGMKSPRCWSTSQPRKPPEPEDLSQHPPQLTRPTRRKSRHRPGVSDHCCPMDVRRSNNADPRLGLLPIICPAAHYPQRNRAIRSSSGNLSSRFPLYHRPRNSARLPAAADSASDAEGRSAGIRTFEAGRASPRATANPTLHAALRIRLRLKAKPGQGRNFRQKKPPPARLGGPREPGNRRANTKVTGASNPDASIRLLTERRQVSGYP